MFFTGKGGVGKTSLACAVALRMAASGRRVLLVSTDPASNLDEVLSVKLGSTPTPVPGCTGLDALNIDPEEAAHAYRERVIGPMRGILPAAALRSMEEQLSGSCTVEIAAFDEFTALIGNPEAALRERLDEIPSHADLRVYCTVGMRGYVATRLLRQHGLGARNLSGGLITERFLRRGAVESGSADDLVSMQQRWSPASRFDSPSPNLTNSQKS